MANEIQCENGADGHRPVEQVDISQQLISQDQHDHEQYNSQPAYHQQHNAKGQRGVARRPVVLETVYDRLRDYLPQG